MKKPRHVDAGSDKLPPLIVQVADRRETRSANPGLHLAQPYAREARLEIQRAQRPGREFVVSVFLSLKWGPKYRIVGANTEEVEAIELLTLLVERYEQAHYAIPEADAVSVVRLVIEQQGLTQRNLTPEFGSESAVSMFLAGQRNFTLGQVRKWSSGFKLPADIFIRRPYRWPQTKIPPRSSDLAVTRQPTTQNGLVDLRSTSLSLDHLCFFPLRLSLLSIRVRLERLQLSVLQSCG